MRVLRDYQKGQHRMSLISSGLVDKCFSLVVGKGRRIFVEDRPYTLREQGSWHETDPERKEMLDDLVEGARKSKSRFYLSAMLDEGPRYTYETERPACPSEFFSEPINGYGIAFLLVSEEEVFQGEEDFEVVGGNFYRVLERGKPENTKITADLAREEVRQMIRKHQSERGRPLVSASKIYGGSVKQETGLGRFFHALEDFFSIKD